MNMRDVKALTDIVASIRDAANNATNEKYALELERYAVQIEKQQFQIERAHSDEIDNLKSRHSQAIEEVNRKHVAAIGTLKAEQAAEKADFQERITKLEAKQNDPRRKTAREWAEEATHQNTPLDEPKKKILAALSGGPRGFAYVQSALGMSEEAVSFHLDEMRDWVDGHEDCWDDRLSLNKAGRKLAVKLGIIKAE